MKVQDIELSLIDPAPVQIRRLDISIMEEMRASINQVGLLQPILVRPRGERFEVVAGNHRFEVEKSRSSKTIPCIVRDLNDDDAVLTGIIENSQRNAHLDASLEGEIFDDLCTKGWKPEAIAKKLGKQYHYVFKRLEIYRKLHPKLLNRVSQRKISLDLAYNIAQHPMNEQLEVAKQFQRQRRTLQDGRVKCHHCPAHCPNVVKL